MTCWNLRLEMMAGKAFSTLTGGAPSLAVMPQTMVPVYTSFSSMVWTVVLSHLFPLAVGMPSALRVLTTSRMLLPRSTMSKMRRTTASTGGSGSSLGLFLAPSCT